ncbi:hypothetical protein BCF44_13018 [Kutzneria buriramensis]|uniref:IrrE N-terminal-like domain-containing protein n=2 Tax=Kutzneria buriramensis TaxID=1045776 RepID=A0A3E0GVS8_9PSEU|nr:hypothetical protein BCF44_13018 [Kutzneria buriramensis]
MVARWSRRAVPGSLRRRCQNELETLDLRAGAEIQDVIDHIGQRRGRPVRLVPFDLPVAAPEGFLIATHDEDFIVFERRAVPLYQRQIVLHEVAHLVFQHETETVLAEDAIAMMMPSLDPAMVQRVLGREHTNSVAEQEAELLASMMGQRISPWTPDRAWDVVPEDRELVERLVRALGRADHPGTR